MWPWVQELCCEQLVSLMGIRSCPLVNSNWARSGNKANMETLDSHGWKSIHSTTTNTTYYGHISTQNFIIVRRRKQTGIIALHIDLRLCVWINKAYLVPYEQLMSHKLFKANPSIYCTEPPTVCKICLGAIPDLGSYTDQETYARICSTLSVYSKCSTLLCCYK